MSDTIQRPAWATSHEGTDEEWAPGWYLRVLATVGLDPEIVTQYGTSPLVPQDYELSVSADAADAETFGARVSDPHGPEFLTVAAMRRYAAELTKVADEWERVTGGAQ